MLNATTTSMTVGPTGRWHRAQVLLRLAGLTAVWYGLACCRPGFRRPVSVWRWPSAVAWRRSGGW